MAKRRPAPVTTAMRRLEQRIRALDERDLATIGATYREAHRHASETFAAAAETAQACASVDELATVDRLQARATHRLSAARGGALHLYYDPTYGPGLAAIWQAVLATLVRDRIPVDTFEALMGPWCLALGEDGPGD